MDDRVVRVYEDQLIKVEEERRSLEDKLVQIGVSTVSFETALEMLTDYLKDPSIVWENGDLNAKKSVLRLIFADKLAYHPKDGFGTVQGSLFVDLFEQLTTKKSQDVEVSGIGPESRER